MKLRYVRGFPLPEKFPLAKAEAFIDYPHKDGDIIISTYPKTGTTWVQYIVWQILHKAESFPSFEDSLLRVMPFADIVGPEVIDKLLPPRFYKTHFPHYHLNINPNSKYIYIHRHPKDTVVSYFYFHNEMRSDTEEFEEFNDFFEHFMTGKIPYGDYFDHVLSFYPYKNDNNVLFLSYEELKRDTAGNILRIAKFIGDCYYQTLKNDDVLFQKIMTVTSFDYMKANLKVKKPPHRHHGESSSGNEGDSVMENSDEIMKVTNFFRKGIVGDGKLHLSLEQQERLMEKASKKMKGTDVLETWLRY